MTTIELPTQDYTLNERLRLVLEGAVPVLLIVVIVSLVLFRVDVTSKFQATAHSISVTACQAVKDSNDDLDAFLSKQASKAHDPGFQKFVDDLKADHAVTYQHCLHH